MYKNTNIYVYAHINLIRYNHNIYKYIYIHMYVYLYEYIYMYLHKYAYIDMYIYLDMYIYIYIYIYVCIYTNMHETPLHIPVPFPFRRTSFAHTHYLHLFM